MKNRDNNFKSNFLLKLKNFLKRTLTKQILIAFGIIVLILAIGFGGVKLYQYSRVAYLKPYIEKYNIEYPDGILEEMCDAYGKNQTTLGRINISDTKTDRYVLSVLRSDYAFLENGSDITKDQHFRAIRLNARDADLERVYSKPEGFLNSSQIVEFTTLFEKEQYKVVAAFYTNTKPEDDNGYLFPYNLYGNLTEKSFEDYKDRITHRALYDTGYEFLKEDYFLTLSVDSDFMEDFRFVVVCVKIDKDEFEKSKTAEPNDNVHYPQVWYDENEKNNVFIFSSKWYPEIYIDEENTTKLSIDDFE